MFSLPTQPLATTISLFYISMDLPILIISYQRNHTVHGPWFLAYFTQHRTWRFIHVVACVNTLFLLTTE